VNVMRGAPLIGVLVLVCAGLPASAQELAEIGNLTCSLAEQSGSPDTESGIGQARDMLCTFQPATRGAEETYTGTLQSAGDERPLDKGVLMWTVRGPAATEIQPGLLHQSFTVDAAAAANQVAPLIGERTPIVLQAAKKEMQQAPDTDSAKPTTVIISIVLKLKSSPA
jgi:Protein of unknown function (DUF992)